jgi:hypothetical protein
MNVVNTVIPVTTARNRTGVFGSSALHAGSELAFG